MNCMTLKVCVHHRHLSEEKRGIKIVQNVLGHGNQAPNKAFLNSEEVSVLSQSDRSLAQMHQVYDQVQLHSYRGTVFNRIFMYLILT